MTLSLRNCPFAFKCDRKWANLKKTADPDIKFCTDCQKEVYRCHSDSELAEAIALNRCVAIQLDDFLRPDEELVMGMMETPRYPR